MQRNVLLVIIAAVLLTTGCAGKLNEWGVLSDNFLTPVTNVFPSGALADGSPVEIESVQLTERFFACTGRDGRRWGEEKTEFTEEETKIVLVAKLDDSRDRAWIIIEAVSPDGRIVAKEKRRFKEGEQLGFAFSPSKLLENSDSGQWRGLFWADGDPIGFVDFTLVSDEDLAEAGAEYEVLEEGASEPILSPDELAGPPFDVSAESK